LKRRKTRKRTGGEQQLNLTPMIDVTFQLLVFFILCTRFKDDERNHRGDLPLVDGQNPAQVVPKMHVGIHCRWDAETGLNTYTVGGDGRATRAVQGSQARLHELVILPSDGSSVVGAKKERYREIFDSLVHELEVQLESGAEPDKMEISFAREAKQGAQSGTAPWMFVSLALDAAARLNERREKSGLEPLPVAFKFVDALGKYSK